MSDGQKRAAKIIEATTNAIEKITDPAKRQAAQQLLKQMQKAATQVRPASHRMPDRDIDFGR